MTSTLIAIYDDPVEAERVRQELIEAGFRDSDINLSSREEEATRREKGGFWSRLRHFLGMEEARAYEEATRRGGTAVTLNAPDDRVDRAMEIMERHNPIDVESQAKAQRAAGTTGPVMETARREEPAAMGEQRQESIPIAEERLRVGKRAIQRGGVRVYSHVVEKPVEETIGLRDEHVRVERHPVDRPAGEEAFREQTIEATEMHEEPVVAKETRIVEEVSLGKEAQERQETVRDTVRRTEIEVEPIAEEEFRRDFEESFANRGLSYEQLRPAYAYGGQLARDQRFAGRNWDLIEPEAQREFEQRRLGSWSDYREAVQHGYERMRSQPGR